MQFDKRAEIHPISPEQFPGYEDAKGAVIDELRSLVNSGGSSFLEREVTDLAFNLLREFPKPSEGKLMSDSAWRTRLRENKKFAEDLSSFLSMQGQI